MELSYAVKKSPSQSGLSSSSYSQFPHRITPVKAGGQPQLGGLVRCSQAPFTCFGSSQTKRLKHSRRGEQHSFSSVVHRFLNTCPRARGPPQAWRHAGESQLLWTRRNDSRMKPQSLAEIHRIIAGSVSAKLWKNLRLTQRKNCWFTTESRPCQR